MEGLIIALFALLLIQSVFMGYMARDMHRIKKSQGEQIAIHQRLSGHIDLIGGRTLGLIDQGLDILQVVKGIRDEQFIANNTISVDSDVVNGWEEKIEEIRKDVMSHGLGMEVSIFNTARMP